MRYAPLSILLVLVVTCAMAQVINPVDVDSAASDAGFLKSLAGDTNPQLGGNLDGQGNTISNATVTFDASGMDGNLTTDDDTVQELADAVDGLSVGGGGGGGTVTHRWDYVYAESVGLAVGPAQPSSYVTNLVYGTVTQQVDYLAFDDTTTEYTGLQTWRTDTTWNSNITFRGQSWYVDATPDAQWTFHYCADGLTASTVSLDPATVAATPTNLHEWVVNTNLTGITPGQAVHYWISRDTADTGTGDNYLRSIAIGWEQQ